MYDLLRKVLFWFPPEGVHYFSMNSLTALNSVPGLTRMLRPAAASDPALQTEAFGLTFRNPVGLAAGFDKNARWLDELAMIGFGSIEIGTVTPKAQAGNDKPRLFRVPQHQALINRMGFNNDGVKAVAARLSTWRNSRSGNPMRPGTVIVGGNIGKNKSTPNEDAWKDYEYCFRELFPFVDYFVVNVSSPNTPGLRELQEKDSLNKILSHLQTINRQQSAPKPILLKIAPDLSLQQVDDVVSLALDISLDGLVATNTTIGRDALTSVSSAERDAIGAGGLSGAPLKERSTEIVRHIHRQTGGRVPMIASGGIFTAEDAQDKLQAGATLVQVWTGFVYEGPAIVKNICQGLLKAAPRIEKGNNSRGS